MKLNASEVILVTDPDREGEKISWHLDQKLHLENPHQVTYTEITEKAVLKAIAHPSPLDLNLVVPGRCRDTLDKLSDIKDLPCFGSLGMEQSQWGESKVALSI